jgi:PIN domain nuclease of toxin-antitoxin system
MANATRVGQKIPKAAQLAAMILLDTVALIRLVQRTPMKESARAALRIAELQTIRLAVSAIAAWECCLLEKRGDTGDSLGSDGETWFYSAVSKANLIVLPIDEKIAIESRRLTGFAGKDPADRFVVATARILDLQMITSDSLILKYAKQGHVRAIQC